MKSALLGTVVAILVGVVAPESVAEGKPTTQSSLGWGGIPERAVDGNTDPIYGGASCTHTNGANSWWAVDLQGLYEVTSVKIFNRKDCCGDRLQNFDIMVGDIANVGGMTLCHHQQSAVGAVGEFTCTKPTKGRSVMIKLMTGNWLTLCEVQVFGDFIAAVPKSIAADKPTTQSSLGWGGVPERAVDGNTDPFYGGTSCTHTNGANSWWAVDLQGVYKVTSVRIYNRVDCCGDRLQNFDIMVGDIANVGGMTLCHHQHSAVGAVREFTCTKPTKGRSVMIKLMSGNWLTLCEVQVFGNFVAAVPKSIAAEKPTSQSSLGWGGVPERAVDGNTNLLYGGASCTHTNGANSWWAVDLQGVYKVTSIIIYNRVDCCGDRLKNFDIMVGDIANAGGMTLCHHQHSAVGAIGEFTCTNPTKGRSVMIKLMTGNWLTLCEVQVFGDFVAAVPESIAVGKPTSQSSLGWGGVSWRAVDGNTDAMYSGNSCTHTNGADSWWAVDLEGVHEVTSVRIYNRLDCCSDRLQNFDIMVGDIANVGEMTLCHHQHSAVGAVGEFTCTKTTKGRSVMIKLLSGTYLTLCEVEVFEKSIVTLSSGCTYRRKFHAPGSVWIESLPKDRNKECTCVDPDSWNSSDNCKGVCLVEGKKYYADEKYTHNNQACRCNKYGQQLCK